MCGNRLGSLAAIWESKCASISGKLRNTNRTEGPSSAEHRIQDVIRLAAQITLVIAVLDERHRGVGGSAHMVIGADIIDGYPAADELIPP